MKNIKSKILAIVEIIVNGSLLPLFYVKIFHETAVLPGYDADGNFVTFKKDYYYSIIDNLRYDPLRLVHLSMGIILMSIVVSIVSLFMDNKNLKAASHTFALCSVAFFIFVLLVASTIRRNY